MRGRFNVFYLCEMFFSLLKTQRIWLYRVSQEERTKLREGVPYVNLYRYNPKHLCPKLNGYWDNGQIKLWTSFGSTNDSCQLVSLNCKCTPVRHTNCWRSPEMHIPSYVRQAGRQAEKPGDVTAQHSSVMYSTSNPMYYYTLRGTLQFKLMALCHSQVTLMLSTDINITETTYSCQFQCKFGNQ